MPVAVIIQEGASSVPALQTGGSACRDARFLRYVREGAIAVVAIERAVSPVADEQIFVPVIVVIPDADALAPTRASQSGLYSHVGECAVAIVLIEAADWLIALRVRGG